MKSLLVVALLMLLTLSACANKVEPDPTILEIQERGTLIVGSDIPYGVMEYLDHSGNPAGIDYDIAKEIADDLGVELEFRTVAWDELFDAVKSGEIDLAMSSITITAERSREMLFSKPYFNTGQVLIAQGNHDNTHPDGYIGETVGVQEETTGETEARRLFDEDLVFTYPSVDIKNKYEGIVYDLNEGVIDHIIIDYIVGFDLVNEVPGLQIVGKPLTEENYAIATKLGNDALIERINKKIIELEESGRIEEITESYKKNN